MKQLRLLGKIILLVAGSGILYAYAMFQGGFVSWFLLYSFIPFILYALLLSIYPLKYWKIERVLNQNRLEVGDTLTVQLTITRRLPFPLYLLLIEERIPDSLHYKNKKHIRFPLFKRKIKISYEVESLQRGEHLFQETKLMTADFLGFIQKEIVLQKQDRILVYPRVLPIQRGSLEKSQGDGDFTKGIDDRNEVMIPAGTREYVHGDRLSWINWKMTANKNQPMTKEFEKTESKQMVIWMDRSMTINPSHFEKIVQYSASFVTELAKTNIPVGLVSIGKEETIFPIKKIGDYLQQMLAHFAVVRNDSSFRINELVESKGAVLTNGTTLVLVTEHLNEDLLNSAKKLANQRHKIVLMLASNERMAASGSFHLNHRNIIVNRIDESYRKKWNRGEIK